MGIMDEDDPQKRGGAPITVGEDLSRLSENDLERRIPALEAEISRTKDTLKQRGNIREAADAFFKK